MPIRCRSRGESSSPTTAAVPPSPSVVPRRPPTPPTVHQPSLLRPLPLRSRRRRLQHRACGRHRRPLDARRRRRRRRAHSRCGCGDRRQHGAQPDGAHRHQLPQRAGEVARGEPQGDQRLPQPQRAGQGQLHPPHRVRHRARHRRRGAEHEQQLRRSRRRQAAPHSQRARQHGPRGRRRQGRRVAHARRAGAARCRHTRLRRVPRRVRRAHPQGEGQQARRLRLPGCHDQPHQPGHDRHRPERATVDARPGRHHRRRQHRLPGRVPGRRRRRARLDRRQQGRHDHEHLRPPHHPGRREWPVPEAGARVAARRARLLRGRVPEPRRAVRGRQVAPGREPGEPRRGDAAEADAGGHAHPRAPCARPPHRRPRPAALAQAAAAARARPGHLRPHHLGPRPRVPHRWRRAASTG